MENDKTTPVVPPLLKSNGQPSVPTKEELQAFIQARSYYYIPKWESFDPTLKRVTLGKFNWAACFLNVFWMAYRRMYLFVIILVAIEAGCYSIVELVFGLPTSVTNGVGIAMMIILGRYGNSIYRKHVERKIRQIKTSMEPEYWPQGFRDSGGTSLWAPIPLIILHLLTLYGMYVDILQKYVNVNIVANTANTGTVAQTAKLPTFQAPAETQTEQPPAIQTPADSEFDQQIKDASASAWWNQGQDASAAASELQDYVEAVKSYRKAADQGNATAQRMLGVCYEKGQGVPQDYAEAVKWYRKAADQGNAAAQWQLGYFYLCISKNYAEAVKWYRRAADQNDAYCQDMLGRFYRDGQGVETNLVEAYKWYNLASAQGYKNPGYANVVAVSAELGMAVSVNVYPDATSERDALAALMTPDQIAEAQRLSREFHPHTESAAEAAAMAAQDAAQDAKNMAQADLKLFGENKTKAENGDADAQCYLGYCYASEKGVTKDLNKAVKWFRRAADQNEIVAQNNLGYCYYSISY